MTEITDLVVKLAPGQVGFYDEVSGTHLSLTNREALISNEKNKAGLITAVKAGKITVVSGSLETGTSAYKKAESCMPTYYRLLEKKRIQELKVKPIKAVELEEEIKIVEPVVEIEKEPVVEEPITEEEVIVEEVVVKKKSNKKKVVEK